MPDRSAVTWTWAPRHTLTVECPDCGAMVNCEPAVESVEKHQRALHVTFVSNLEQHHVCLKSV